MRYFKDGDLVYGLDPTKKAYDLNSLEADYYIAWIHQRAELLNHLRHASDENHYRASDPERYLNEQMVMDSHFPDTSRATVIKLQQPDNTRSSKQSEKGGKPLWINVEFKDSFKLQYFGKYNDNIYTTYNLEKSESNNYEFSDTCEMHFGAVHDDNGHPFLRLRFDFATSNKRGDPKPMRPMEIVAKRIDDGGSGELGKRDFSKNEKLRLGFHMNWDGTFVTDMKELTDGTTPMEVAEPEETMASLQKKLEAKVMEVGALREKADKMMADWTAKLDQITTALPRSPASRRPDPADANGIVSSNSIITPATKSRVASRTNGSTNGPTNGRAVSSSNESEVSLASERVRARSKRVANSHPENTRMPTDELATPESSQRVTKRPRLTNGSGHS